MMKNAICILSVILLLSHCAKTKKRDADSLGELKKVTLTIFPPVMPAEFICIKQKYEVDPKNLIHTIMEGGCDDTLSQSKDWQAPLSPKVFTQITTLLQNLKEGQFVSQNAPNASDYDGNPTASLVIEWAKTQEYFSFVHYEGEELNELLDILHKDTPLPKVVYRKPN